MEKNTYYPLKLGWYDAKEKWTNFCSSDCQEFMKCVNRGGFCSSSTRRILQPQAKPFNENLLHESGEMYEGISAISEGKQRGEPLFWHFPRQEGDLQPWRHKLWSLKK